MLANSIGASILLPPEQQRRPVPLQAPVRLDQSPCPELGGDLIQLAREQPGADERGWGRGRGPQNTQARLLPSVLGTPPSAPPALELSGHHLQDRRGHVGDRGRGELGEALTKVDSLDLELYAVRFRVRSGCLN